MDIVKQVSFPLDLVNNTCDIWTQHVALHIWIWLGTYLDWQNIKALLNRLLINTRQLLGLNLIFSAYVNIFCFLLPPKSKRKYLGTCLYYLYLVRNLCEFKSISRFFGKISWKQLIHYFTVFMKYCSNETTQNACLAE